MELTCENTHTVLPYIDLVNEILEHYVVNESIDDFEGFNIEEETTTDELMANPQFVNDEAYRKLNGDVGNFKRSISDETSVRQKS